MAMIAAIGLALAIGGAPPEPAPSLPIAPGGVRAGAPSADPAETEDLDRLISHIDREPTERILLLAERLFRSGRKDEGVFWYYVFQLRARMEAQTDSGAAEAYGAIFETIGPQFNEYAAGDVSKLLAMMDRVLAWDAAHPLKGVDPKVRAKQRAGLANLRAYTAAHLDELRRERAKRGLPNSGH